MITRYLIDETDNQIHTFFNYSNRGIQLLHRRRNNHIAFEPALFLGRYAQDGHTFYRRGITHLYLQSL